MTPISPELSLAMNMVANPGVYALLLGSGVSRSAGIPTGWDIVLALVRKLAQAQGDDPEPHPDQWYESKYGEPPRYSSLLESIAPEPPERQPLLKEYFEPTDEEREEGLKTPTAAHRAVADLVAGGWIRVIVTTNFDRLLELALEDAGVRPVVIASADQANGAPPLAHNACTVIKVHGDYLDTRIRNSDDELAAYDPAMDALLDRVFDEYGLVVCGWSGEYDVALRDALDRCKSRRYTTYWCARGELNSVVQPTADNRAAQLVSIRDADTFFTELEEKVTAIQATDKQHPMETRAAVETLKRYLPEERHRIRLRELVRDATEELVSYLSEDEFPISTQYTPVEIASRIRRLDPLCERTIAMIANGCFYGTPQQDDVWLEIIRRLADVEIVNSAANRWGSLFRYPALLALYAAGIASVAKGRYDLVASLLLTPVRSRIGLEPEPIVQSMWPGLIVPDGADHLLFPHPNAPKQRYLSPRNHYLHRELRPAFTALVPSEEDYNEAFDRFEYLALLVESDFESRGEDSLYSGHRWFGGRAFAFGVRPFRIAERVDAEEIRPLLAAGLFDGKAERLLEVKSKVDSDMRRAHR